MKYIIAPWSGWSEEFFSKEEAFSKAEFYLSTDEEGLRTVHGYKNPCSLVDERWDSVEEMYSSLLAQDFLE